MNRSSIGQSASPAAVAEAAGGRAFFGLALMSGTGLLLADWFGATGRDWGPSALEDQQAGGGIAWMVIPQTFSVGLEGLYYFFDQEKVLADATFDLGPGDLDVRATATLDDAWVVRTRADFHF